MQSAFFLVACLVCAGHTFRLNTKIVSTLKRNERKARNASESRNASKQIKPSASDGKVNLLLNQIQTAWKLHKSSDYVVGGQHKELGARHKLGMFEFDSIVGMFKDAEAIKSFPGFTRLDPNTQFNNMMAKNAYRGMCAEGVWHWSVSGTHEGTGETTLFIGFCFGFIYRSHALYAKLVEGVLASIRSLKTPPDYIVLVGHSAGGACSYVTGKAIVEGNIISKDRLLVVISGLGRLPASLMQPHLSEQIPYYFEFVQGVAEDDGSVYMWDIFIPTPSTKPPDASPPLGSSEVGSHYVFAVQTERSIFNAYKQNKISKDMIQSMTPVGSYMKKEDVVTTATRSATYRWTYTLGVGKGFDGMSCSYLHQFAFYLFPFESARARSFLEGIVRGRIG